MIKKYYRSVRAIFVILTIFFIHINHYPAVENTQVVKTAMFSVYSQ